MTGQVEIRVDGHSVTVTEGMTIAAALANVGADVLRLSVSEEPRGVLCAMGVCQECRVTVDGIAHRRACMTFVKAGMVVERGTSHG